MNLRPTQRRARAATAIDITSLVDVVFLLLIFLLVTTTFKKQEHAFPIELPTAGVDQVTIKSDKTTIVITRSGELHLLMVPLDGDTDGSGSAAATVDKVSRAQLAQRLAELHKHRPDTPIAIRGDNETSYQKMIDVVALVEQAGFRNIWFPYQLDKSQ